MPASMTQLSVAPRKPVDGDREQGDALDQLLLGEGNLAE
jgi:hypothetical protein